MSCLVPPCKQNQYTASTIPATWNSATAFADDGAQLLRRDLPSCSMHNCGKQGLTWQTYQQLPLAITMLKVTRMQTSNTESGIVSITEVKLDTQTHKATHMSTKRTGKKHNMILNSPALILRYASSPLLTPPQPMRGSLPLVKRYISARVSVDS